MTATLVPPAIAPDTIDDVPPPSLDGAPLPSFGDAPLPSLGDARRTSRRHRSGASSVTPSGLDVCSTRAEPAKRIADLELACNALWSSEPAIDHDGRSRLLRQLSDVERCVAGLALRLVVDPDADTKIDDRLWRCERRVDELRREWGR